jgi:4-hydroxy-3-methylbut-2-enyl diphosphate reductase
MTVDIDERSGFCFGVVHAIRTAEEALLGGEVCCLGDIVHNRVEVSRLEAAGLRTILHADLPRLAGQTVLIRAHGEPPATYAEAAKHGIALVDATCPVVARLQKQVKEAHEQMKCEGGQVVILGKRGHAEVVGLAGQAGGEALIV